MSLLATVGLQAETSGETLNVDRYPGMGYGVTDATVDFTAAKEFLGKKK